MPWTKKYLPKNSTEIQAQKKQVDAIKTFITQFRFAKKKALLLYGPPGCGKTSSVYAIAKELDKELIEVNASDTRTSETIEQTVGMASKNASFFSKGKVILVDEVDGISGMQDRGGIATIAKIIESTKFPIILTANDPYDKKFAPLRKVCELIEFDTLSYVSIHVFLKKICEAETLIYNDDDVKSLARRAGGDLRGAITDLQTVSAGTKKILRESFEDLGQRQQSETIMTALMKILKSTDPLLAKDAFELVDEDLDKCILWVDENIPLEYKKPHDLYRAYDALSKADIFLSRIRRWQHWRYMIYASDLTTAGVAVAKDQKYPFFTPFKPTSRILKLWQAKMKHQKRNEIAQKIADATHSSKKRVIRDVLAYVKYIAHNDIAVGDAISQECDMSTEEFEWLCK